MKEGEWGRKAFQYFEEMQRSGLKPDGVTFNSLIPACRLLSTLEESVQGAKKYFQMMLSMGYAPDGYTITACVNCCRQKQLNKKAAQWFLDECVKHPDFVISNKDYQLLIENRSFQGTHYFVYHLPPPLFINVNFNFILFIGMLKNDVNLKKMKTKVVPDDQFRALMNKKRKHYFSNRTTNNSVGRSLNKKQKKVKTKTETEIFKNFVRYSDTKPKPKVKG